MSLLGSAIDSIALSSDKAQVLVGSSIEGQTTVNETNLTVLSDTYGSGYWSREGYVVVQNPVAGSAQISSSLTVVLSGYRTVGSEHRIYMRVAGDFQFFTIGESTVDVSYSTAATVDNSAGQATITATVSQSDDSPVTDGTLVQFGLDGWIDATLSSSRAYTSGGKATTILTAGKQTGSTRVSAICGSQKADLSIDVVSVITDDTGVGTISYPSGTDTGSNTPEDSGTDGSIRGTRRLVGCEGEPLARVWVSLCGGQISRQTDSNGVFRFDCGVIGDNTGSVTIDGKSYQFVWTIADPQGV